MLERGHLIGRFSYFMVGCLTLTLLVGCSAAEKPVEQVKQVKNTLTAKLATEEKMIEIDGQTIYFKRLVMKNHLYL